MKKYLLISFLAFNVLSGYAQKGIAHSAVIDSGAINKQHLSDSLLSPIIPVNSGGKQGEIFYLQAAPKFPGGDKELLNYIQNHINYSAVSPHVTGRVLVHFVVDENGNVKMANVPKGMGIGGGCDEEAIRVITSLPKWEPGKQNGHAVSVWYTVPVIFRNPG